MKVSRPLKNGIGNEMEADSPGPDALLEVTRNCFGNLALQVSEALGLSGDPAGAIRCIPGSNEPPGIFVSLDFEDDLFHEPILPFGLGTWEHWARLPRRPRQ